MGIGFGLSDWSGGGWLLTLCRNRSDIAETAMGSSGQEVSSIVEDVRALVCNCPRRGGDDAVSSFHMSRKIACGQTRGRILRSNLAAHTRIGSTCKRLLVSVGESKCEKPQA